MAHVDKFTCIGRWSTHGHGVIRSVMEGYTPGMRAYKSSFEVYTLMVVPGFRSPSLSSVRDAVLVMSDIVLSSSRALALQFPADFPVSTHPLLSS
jgi:hypothetical protein